MTEQQNWELMGQVFKADAEDLRKERKVIITAIKTLKKDLTDFLDCSEISPTEFNAITTLLELVK